MPWVIAPYFPVDNVVATANWYRDQLGVSYERFWGDPPAFCMVKRGGVITMLSLQGTGLVRPNHVASPGGEAWDADVWVDDADALFQEFTRQGVTITRGLCDQPYDMHEVDVEDCNGYRICFGHDTSAS